MNVCSERHWGVVVGTALLAVVVATVFGTAIAASGEDGGDAGSVPPENPTLDDYVAHARRASPALRAAGAHVTASSERATVVGSLPDPVVSYGYYVESVETRVGPQEHRIGVRQKLPWFGKLSHARKAAGAGADAVYERYRDAYLALVSDVTEAYSEYAYLARAVEIGEERLGLLRRLESVVRRKYSAGTASYADVMKAQIELARAESDLEALLDLREPLSANLAAVANVPAEAVLPWPGEIPDAAASLSKEEALAILRDSNPELRGLDLEVEAARSSLAVAERSQFPDLTVGLDYIVTGEAAMPVPDSGKDPIVATASINVPLWFGARRAAVREAEARLLAAERSRDDREKKVGARLDMALYRLGDAERRVDLHRDRLVPMARQSLGAAEASYEAGAADFDSLVAAEQTLLEFELALVRARTDRAVAAAALDRILGRGDVPVPHEAGEGAGREEERDQ